MIPETEIPIVVALHDAFGVTAREARGLALLAQGGIVPIQCICEVYCEGPYSGPDEGRHMLKRIKRRAPQISFITHRGVGYELEQHSLALVRQAMRATA